MHNVHIQIDAAGNFIVKDLILGWCVSLDGDIHLLSDFTDEDRSSILKQVPQSIAAEARATLIEFDKRAAVELSDSNTSVESEKELDMNASFLFDTIKVSADEIKRRANEALSSIPSEDSEFKSFIQGIVSADDVIKHVTDLRKRNIHTGWLADFGA